MSGRAKVLSGLLVALALAGCGVEQKESDQTYHNRTSINAAIPVPEINFSTRRWVLAQFYLMLAQPRLETCTIFTARGGDHTEIGVAPSYGSPVNLSNQMTAPNISEPDSVYSGTNDQTVVILRNGAGVIAEGDTNAVIGECPPDMMKPKTAFQATIDYTSVTKPKFNFLEKKW